MLTCMCISSGSGLAESLMHHVIAQAHTLGYPSVRLDTLTRLKAANKLYARELREMGCMLCAILSSCVCVVVGVNEAPM